MEHVLGEASGMDEAAAFGRSLQRRRKAIDLTQQELALRVHCAAESIRKFEAGRQRPSKQLAERLADAVAVPADERAAFLKLARARTSLAKSAHAAQHTDGRTTHLPNPPTPLIGRTAEVRDVATRLVHEDMHLVTLVGPAGVGKTRMAVQVAIEVAHAFRHGVYFVPLAPVRDAALVPAAIAQALGLTLPAGHSPTDSVKQRLRDQHVLLVLDNFEHLLDAGAVVAELCQTAPRLRVLVTSRATLQLYGECTYVVPPLALPPVDWATADRRSVSQLDEFSSVRLFVERGRFVRADFRLTDANAPAVVAICRHLDGLPLAIELAAARLRLFPPDELLARLESRLTLLTGGARDLPARQQTLRRTIDWSYELLDQTEQALWRRLAVFVGGFTATAAEAVCADTSVEPPLPAPATVPVLDVLQSLLQRSLVHQESQLESSPRATTSAAVGEARFTMLETLGEYAIEQLAAHGEADVLQARHAGVMLKLVQQAAPALEGGAEQSRWLQRLEQEHANLRAALRWALANDPATALGLACNLGLFWLIRGHIPEGRAWLARVLANSTGQEPSLRATALWHAGNLAWQQSDHAAARTLLQEGLDLACATRSTRTRARVLVTLAQIALERGQVAEAIALAEEGLRHARAVADDWAIRLVVSGLGVAAVAQGDRERAVGLFEESLALARAAADLPLQASALYYLGGLALLAGRLTHARGVLEETSALIRHHGLEGMDGHVLEMAGRVLLAEGERVRAVSLFHTSLAATRKLGYTSCLAHICEAFARVALADAATGWQPIHAVRLLSAADAVCAALGTSMMPIERALYEQTLAAARAALAPDAFAAAWAAGQALTPEQAIDELFPEHQHLNV